MLTFNLGLGISGENKGWTAELLFDRDPLKIRRIVLAAGSRIPPCRMAEDVVFLVLSGRVLFREVAEAAEVPAPGAVFIPGGAAERSMEACEDSLVAAVLVRRPAAVVNNDPGDTPS